MALYWSRVYWAWWRSGRRVEWEVGDGLLVKQTHVSLLLYDASNTFKHTAVYVILLASGINQQINKYLIDMIKAKCLPWDGLNGFILVKSLLGVVAIGQKGGMGGGGWVIGVH
jgi:hypothetical protein